MREKIHPNYGKAVVRCICGETFETGSVKKELRVDICSKCHPFFTGKQKLVDTGGRVDRFKKRYGMESQQPKTQKIRSGDCRPICFSFNELRKTQGKAALPMRCAVRTV